LGGLTQAAPSYHQIVYISCLKGRPPPQELSKIEADPRKGRSGENLTKGHVAALASKLSSPANNYWGGSFPHRRIRAVEGSENRGERVTLLLASQTIPSRMLDSIDISIATNIVATDRTCSI
jgi:hypothetical protein